MKEICHSLLNHRSCTKAVHGSSCSYACLAPVQEERQLPSIECATAQRLREEAPKGGNPFARAAKRQAQVCISLLALPDLLYWIKFDRTSLRR